MDLTDPFRNSLGTHEGETGALRVRTRCRTPQVGQRRSFSRFRRADRATGLCQRVGGAMWMVALICMITDLSNVVSADEVVDRIRRDRAAERVEAYLEEGRQQLERGAHIRAVRVLSEAIKRGARPEAYKYRGQANLASGAYPEAIADFTRYSQSGAGAVEGLILRGDAHTARGDYASALADYNTVIQRDPLCMDAYLGRALAYLGRERYAAAMNDFQVVLQTDARNLEALTNMGLACMSVDLPGAARTYFSRALEGESSPQWRERIAGWLDKLPETSPYEEKIGGLSGFLSRELKGQGLGVSPGSGQPPRTAEGKIAGGLKAEQTATEKRAPSKNLLELRRALDADAGEERPVSGKVSGSDMGFRWNFTFRAKGRHVAGTLRIFGPAGFDETHHCTGTYDRGFVDASDRVGNRFQGRITENLRLVGTLTTNHGMSFAVNMPLEE